MPGLGHRSASDSGPLRPPRQASRLWLRFCLVLSHLAGELESWFLDGRFRPSVSLLALGPLGPLAKLLALGVFSVVDVAGFAAVSASGFSVSLGFWLFILRVRVRFVRACAWFLPLALILLWPCCAAAICFDV